MFIKIARKIKSMLSGSRHVAPYLTKQLWDKQYSSGAWDYLESDKEKEHYLVIVDFLRKHNIKGSVLDIGCGTGILYSYLSKEYPKHGINYYGVDISDSAIAQARDNHSRERFDVCNYENETLTKQFDCIIFNETLYYFADTVGILKKCVEQNLVSGGKLIISMVEYQRHYTIWDIIDKDYRVFEEKTVKNEDGVTWTIKIIGK